MASYRTPPSIAILGGGQLGMMLVQAGASVPARFEVMDHNPQAPAGGVAPLFVGDVGEALDVVRFGVGHDVVTIEKEAVSARGLSLLEKDGIAVYPQSRVVAMIQDKGRQKAWITEHGFPTAAFELYDDACAIRRAFDEGRLALPFVQKVRRAGYDGRGVQVVTRRDALDELLEGPSVTEDCVSIAHELSVIVARNVAGELAVYDPVEMVFRDGDNILDLLVCPARVSPQLADEARELAREVTEALGIVGILAVEMFVDTNGSLLINELAPRPHNSGHHTIESCVTSQYEQHLRAITGHRLGDTTTTSPAVLLNVLGEEGHRGKPDYVGLEALRGAPGVHVHLYGKGQTWPMRKMGHVTICDGTVDGALATAERLRSVMKVRATKETS